MNTVPVYEAKNKLPLFIHQAEQGNPLAITRHNSIVAYLISKEDFEEFREYINSFAVHKENSTDVVDNQ